MLTLAGNIPGPGKAPSPPRQRHTGVQAEQRRPSGGSSSTRIATLLIAATELGRQGAQRLVNRLFERIVETRVPTRIHLRNDATIGAGIVAAFPTGGDRPTRPHPVAPPRRHPCLLRPPRLQRTHRSRQRTARSFAPQRPRIPQTSPTTSGAHCRTAGAPPTCQGTLNYEEPVTSGTPHFLRYFATHAIRRRDCVAAEFSAQQSI